MSFKTISYNQNTFYMPKLHMCDWNKKINVKKQFIPSAKLYYKNDNFVFICRWNHDIALVLLLAHAKDS